MKKTQINRKIGTVTFVKISILPKAIYRFSVIPVKIPMALFTELDPAIPKCIWSRGRPRPATATSRKKSNAGAIALPGIKPHTAKVARTAGCLRKDARGPRGRSRAPRNEPAHIRAVDPGGGGRNTRRVRTVSSASGAGKTGRRHARMKLHPHPGARVKTDPKRAGRLRCEA